MPKQKPGMGHNSAPDPEQVKAFFGRWSRLEDDRDGITEDLKELFIEARSAGMKPKAMRAAFRQRRRHDHGKTLSAEEQAEIDQYLAAIDAPHARVRTRARDDVGASGESPALNPHTGLPILPDIPEKLRRQQTDHAA